MKTLIALVALLASSSCLAAFDVTATMPAPPNSTSCQLLLNGNPAGTTKPCGAAQSYPSLIANPGVYTFTYRGVNASGSGPVSASTTVTISQLPGNPPGAPTITAVCNPGPCPDIVITVTNP